MLIETPTHAADWLATAVVGAAIAALDYVGKQVAELTMAAVMARKARRARLAELLASIRAGDAAFRAQTSVRDRLSKAIIEREPALQRIESYDQLLVAAFPTLTLPERELFDICRRLARSA